MHEIQSLIGGFAVALSWFNLMLMLAGIVLGVIIGVLPGLGGANGVAILLPLTFSMAQQPGGTTSAIILLSCIYWGALFAGDVEEDRCDRSAEERTPIDAREQDDRGSRAAGLLRHRERERQQDGDAVRAAQAGQHAD